MAEQVTIEVEVIYALPRIEHNLFLRLPVGACVQDALDEAAKELPFAALDLAELEVGIYAELINDRQRLLNDKDRLEIYRPLVQNPMQQRRERARLSDKNR